MAIKNVFDLLEDDTEDPKILIAKIKAEADEAAAAAAAAKKRAKEETAAQPLVVAPPAAEGQRRSDDRQQFQRRTDDRQQYQRRSDDREQDQRRSDDREQDQRRSDDREQFQRRSEPKRPIDHGGNLSWRSLGNLTLEDMAKMKNVRFYTRPRRSDRQSSNNNNNNGDNDKVYNEVVARWAAREREKERERNAQGNLEVPDKSSRKKYNRKNAHPNSGASDKPSPTQNDSQDDGNVSGKSLVSEESSAGESGRQGGNAHGKHPPRQFDRQGRNPDGNFVGYERTPGRQQYERQGGNSNGNNFVGYERNPGRQYDRQGGNDNANFPVSDRPRGRGNGYGNHGGSERPYRRQPGYDSGSVVVNHEGATNAELDRTSGNGNGTLENGYRQISRGRRNVRNGNSIEAPSAQALPQEDVGDVKVGDDALTAKDVNKPLESDVKSKDPPKLEMTLQEYQRIFEEKRKSLLALKASEERKVQVDSELETMQQLSLKKGNDEIFIKLGSEKKDSGKQKDEQVKKGSEKKDSGKQKDEKIQKTVDELNRSFGVRRERFFNRPRPQYREGYGNQTNSAAAAESNDYQPRGRSATAVSNGNQGRGRSSAGASNGNQSRGRSATGISHDNQGRGRHDGSPSQGGVSNTSVAAASDTQPSSDGDPNVYQKDFPPLK